MKKKASLLTIALTGLFALSCSPRDETLPEAETSGALPESPAAVDVIQRAAENWGGGDRCVSVFDGKQAAFLRHMNGEGVELGSYLVEEEEVKDWEVEKAWVFPAFFDHPAEYLGLQDLDEVPVHVLRVMLPLGARTELL